MNRLGSTLLRIGPFLLPVSPGHSAESLGDGQAVAPLSASDGVVISAISVMAMHAVASGAPQRTLDLRLPDSQSLRVQDPRQPDTSSESDEENSPRGWNASSKGGARAARASCSGVTVNLSQSCSSG